MAKLTEIFYSSMKTKIKDHYFINREAYTKGWSCVSKKHYGYNSFQ